MRNGWTETTLGEVCRLVKGISYKSDELVSKGEGVPFINLKSIDRGGGFRSDGLKWFLGKHKQEQVVRPGDLVLCCTDLTKEKAILGYPLLVPKLEIGNEFCISLDMATLIVDKDVSSNKFMYLVLQGNQMREFMTTNSSGTTVMHLQTRNVGNARFLLPPLDEQKRIVDVVSSVDAYIDALQQQADTARTARNAVLHELLTTGGDDWTETTLGEVADTRLGKMLSATTDDGSGEMHPYLRNTNVRWGEVDLSDLKKMRFSKKDCETLTLLAGDLLICEGGEPGRAALLKKDLSGIYFQKAIHRVRCRVGLEPEFLAYWMHHLSRSEIFENFLTSTTIKHLTGEKLRQLPILMPSLTEQRRIVDVVSCIEEVIQATEQAISDANNLRSGLLSDLLSGEHKIPASYDKFLQAA